MEVFFLTDNRQLKDFFAEKIVLITIPLVNIYGAVSYAKSNRAQKSMIGIAAEGVSPLSVVDGVHAPDAVRCPQ